MALFQQALSTDKLLAFVALEVNIRAQIIEAFVKCRIYQDEDRIMIHFPISGVETYWWLPSLVAFLISSLTSTGGVSGGVLILPFQVSALGFTGPAVSPTNLLYNFVAIPSGVYRYCREKRMVWPLTWTIIAGTLPGLFLGAIIRIKYLPEARDFKLFAGLALLYVGTRLLVDVLKKMPANSVNSPSKAGFINRIYQNGKIANVGQFRVIPLEFSLKRIGYEFNGIEYYASTFWLFILSLIVGVVGGVYGIGGGAIIAPFLVTMFRLPVHSVAGAALMGTFLSSFAGVIIYAVISPFYSHTQLAITPDWFLGILFGIGGMVGMYLGARLQRYMPARLIKTLLAVCMLSIAVKYIAELFA